MVEEFKNAPVSINEIRASKFEDAGEWTPRDLLVHLLRQIDNDEIDPTSMIICHKTKGTCGSYVMASPSISEIVEMVSQTEFSLRLAIEQY